VELSDWSLNPVYQYLEVLLEKALVNDVRVLLEAAHKLGLTRLQIALIDERVLREVGFELAYHALADRGAPTMLLAVLRRKGLLPREPRGLQIVIEDLQTDGHATIFAQWHNERTS
jgi:hypothetical protein